MVASRVSRYNRQISPEEQIIYDHFLSWVDMETPAQLVERFQSLFLDFSRYPDAEVAAALERVALSATAVEDFRYVLNRCCHILINRWQSKVQSQQAIPHLVKLFETIPSSAMPMTVTRSRSIRRTRELLQQFKSTEQYHTLRRLAEVLAQKTEGGESYPLGSLIRRYPYLYEYCLLSDDNIQEQQITVRQIQADIQHQFEVNLSQYVTYRVRQAQMVAKAPQANLQSLIRPVSNPTLLADPELSRALKHYVGRIDGVNTHRDLAHTFQASTSQTRFFGDFKDELYDYITSGIDPEYGRRQFNNQLHNQLKIILPDNDRAALNDFLVVRTCSQLLNFLVVDNPQCPNHYVLIDLLMNLGPIMTTGLLLRIVLFCRKVKPYLERRFSILFNHYESYSHEMVQWLIEALEHLNLALSTNFGTIDLSFIR